MHSAVAGRKKKRKKKKKKEKKSDISWGRSDGTKTNVTSTNETVQQNFLSCKRTYPVLTGYHPIINKKTQ